VAWVIARVGVGVCGNQSTVAVGIGVSEGSGVALGSGNTVGAAQPTSIPTIIKAKQLKLFFLTFIRIIVPIICCDIPLRFYCFRQSPECVACP